MRHALSCIAAGLLVSVGVHATWRDAAATEDERPAIALSHLDQGLHAVLERGASLDAADAHWLYEGALLAVRPAFLQDTAAHEAAEAGLKNAPSAAEAKERAASSRRAVEDLRRKLRRVSDKANTNDGLKLSPQEREIIELANAERAKVDVKPLKPNARLCQAARSHSRNMARQMQLSHDLDGKGPSERLGEIGYRHAGFGENCAMGQRTPQEAIETWLGSEGHRANMLNPDYTEIGVGIADDETGQRYFTQLFATPVRQ